MSVSNLYHEDTTLEKTNVLPSPVIDNGKRVKKNWQAKREEEEYGVYEDVLIYLDGHLDVHIPETSRNLLVSRILSGLERNTPQGDILQRVRHEARLFLRKSVFGTIEKVEDEQLTNGNMLGENSYVSGVVHRGKQVGEILLVSPDENEFPSGKESQHEPTISAPLTVSLKKKPTVRMMRKEDVDRLIRIEATKIVPEWINVAPEWKVEYIVDIVRQFLYEVSRSGKRFTEGSLSSEISALLGGMRARKKL